MQLGEVVGQLSTEVLSGGDIGLQMLPDGRAAFLPQNCRQFSAEIEVAADEFALYAAVRELAHARLYHHARWLELHFLTAIRKFASGVRVDMDRLETLATEFDPSNPETLRTAVMNGELIESTGPQQLSALNGIETMLALVEGWITVVAHDATVMLTHREALEESVRRRRATTGPAEQAFATLVGLELRPRRQREAAALWRAITDTVGIERRDDLWSHPDLLPTSADFDNPQHFIERLHAGTPLSEDSEFDAALDSLLRGELPDAPHEEPANPADGTPGAADSGGSDFPPFSDPNDRHNP